MNELHRVRPLLIFLMLRYLFMHTCTALMNAECLFDALVIVNLLGSISWLRLFKSLRVRYCSRALESLVVVFKFKWLTATKQLLVSFSCK